MRIAMTLDAFQGDGSAHCLRNRPPNSIIFTALGDSGESFRAIVAGAVRVRLLAPVSRDMAVTAIVRDGEVFRAQLAGYEGEHRIRAGVYLVSISVIVFDPGGKEYNGTAVATVPIDEDLPEVPRPEGDEGKSAPRP